MAELHISDFMNSKYEKKQTLPEEPKNRFQTLIDDSVEKELDAYAFDNSNPLLSPALQRAKLREELKQSLQLTELSDFLVKAVNILSTDAMAFLSPEEFASLEADLSNAETYLDAVDLNEPLTEGFQKILHFKDSTIDSIFKTALAEYKDSKILESLSLFVLLTNLVPENFDYWNRSGILAQEYGNPELAIRLYKVASELDPTAIGPRVFIVECYLNMKMTTEAKAELDEVIELAKSETIDDSWREIIAAMKDQLNIH